MGWSNGRGKRLFFRKILFGCRYLIFRIIGNSRDGVV